MTPLAMSTNTITFSSGLTPPPSSAASAIGKGFYSRFPVPWAPVSNDPGIQIQITNNMVTAPVAPLLMDVWTNPVDSQSYKTTFVELSTVYPGDTVTETVAGLPVTQMYLVLWHLYATSADAGLTVQIQAWAV